VPTGRYYVTAAHVDLAGRRRAMTVNVTFVEVQQVGGGARGPTAPRQRPPPATGVAGYIMFQGGSHRLNVIAGPRI
jgi:hypothetical protein